MKQRLIAIVALVIGAMAACTPPDEVITDNPELSITFSRDTVTFDTLLTAVGSITKRLRVFNPNKNAIEFSRIGLGRGPSSEYRIRLNGLEDFQYENVTLLGEDSLLILVDVRIDPQDENLPFLVKDSIEFQYAGGFEDVKLVSYGQDANFLRNVILGCNTTWTADRPYVLMDTILVDSACQLNIEPGARIFFDNRATLFIRGQMLARGDTANLIEFTSTRQDGIFADVPGQWTGIFFLEGSRDNLIDQAIISNAQFGLRIGTPDDDDLPDVIVSNTIIRNMSQAGILAFTSDVQATNTLINNCGELMVGNFAGGNYAYAHCTFTNDPNDFFRENPSVQFSNFFELGDGNVLREPINLLMVNSIVWGNLDEELLFAIDESVPAELLIQHNIFRSQLEFPEESNNQISLENNFPGFVSPIDRDFQLDSLANARDVGIDIGITTDILLMERDSLPDLGAYERIDAM